MYLFSIINFCFSLKQVFHTFEEMRFYQVNSVNRLILVVYIEFQFHESNPISLLTCNSLKQTNNYIEITRSLNNFLNEFIESIIYRLNFKDNYFGYSEFWNTFNKQRNHQKIYYSISLKEFFSMFNDENRVSETNEQPGSVIF